MTPWLPGALQGMSGAARETLPWAAVLGVSVALAAVELVPQLTVQRAARAIDAPVAKGVPGRMGPQRTEHEVRGSDERASRPEVPRHYHVQGLNGFQLLSPRALGGPSDYFGDDNYWETVFSIGLVPLVLLVLAVLRHPDRVLVRGWLALVGLALWCACGRRLFLYSVLCAVVPGMSWFRVPRGLCFSPILGPPCWRGLGSRRFVAG